MDKVAVVIELHKGVIENVRVFDSTHKAQWVANKLERDLGMRVDVNSDNLESDIIIRDEILVETKIDESNREEDWKDYQLLQERVSISFMSHGYLDSKESRPLFDKIEQLETLHPGFPSRYERIIRRGKIQR